MLKADYYLPPTEVDLLVYEKLVPPDHYLREVKAVIDFEPLRTLVADCYSKDQGRPADDPVLMFKLHFLELHYDLSDRDVLKEAQVNVTYRFFLDLSLESSLPTPGLLSQFRTRLGAERFNRAFDEDQNIPGRQSYLGRMSISIGHVHSTSLRLPERYQDERGIFEGCH